MHIRTLALSLIAALGLSLSLVGFGQSAQAGSYDYQNGCEEMLVSATGTSLAQVTAYGRNADWLGHYCYVGDGNSSNGTSVQRPGHHHLYTTTGTSISVNQAETTGPLYSHNYTYVFNRVVSSGTVLCAQGWLRNFSSGYTLLGTPCSKLS